MPQIVFGPVGFVLDDLLQSTDGEGLAWTVEMYGHAAAVGMGNKAVSRLCSSARGTRLVAVRSPIGGQ